MQTKTRFAYLTDLSDAARLTAEYCIANGKEAPETVGNMISTAWYAEAQRDALTIEQAQMDSWEYLQQQAELLLAK